MVLPSVAALFAGVAQEQLCQQVQPQDRQRGQQGQQKSAPIVQFGDSTYAFSSMSQSLFVLLEAVDV